MLYSQQQNPMGVELVGRWQRDGLRCLLALFLSIGHMWQTTTGLVNSTSTRHSSNLNMSTSWAPMKEVYACLLQLYTHSQCMCVDMYMCNISCVFHLHMDSLGITIKFIRADDFY